MAAKKKGGAGLAADPAAVIPRTNFAEVGFTGLRTLNGQILEEANRVFRYPAYLKTVDEMSTDPTISAVLNTYNQMITRVEWTVKPPVDASVADKQRANFVQECMADMEITWKQFISEVLPYLRFGFSIQEKVFRRRLTRNGSKYNDGFVGIRKFATRGSDTIRHWNFTPDGRELVSVGQSLRNMENGYRYQLEIDAPNGLLTIPREKFLLFSADSIKGNPEGKSILKSVYLPYKQLTMIKDQMFLGVAKDLAAIPIVQLPAKLMDANASPADQAAYLAYQTLVNNVATGTQRGIIMPSDVDENKVPMFKFDLLEAKGQSKFDLLAIIKALQTDILVALSADVITSVADTQGSFAIKNAQTNLLAIAIEHRLNEIRDVLNSDLMVQIFQLNGWDTSNLPTFEFGDIVDTDTEAFSKFIQRTASVGLVEVDRPVLNKVRTVMGIAPLADDAPVNPDDLSAATTRSGDGMEVGKSGDGTADIGGKSSKQDKSAKNADNAA